MRERTEDPGKARAAVAMAVLESIAWCRRLGPFLLYQAGGQVDRWTVDRWTAFGRADRQARRCLNPSTCPPVHPST
jgi:hypothetical protein